MGMLSSIFGWDQSKGAMNAVMASYLFDNASDDQKFEIIEEIIRIHQYAWPSMDPMDMLRMLSESNRIAQMNFVALACENLSIPTPARNNVWSPIDNPYSISAKIKDNWIDAAVATVAKQHGFKIEWPGRDCKIDFIALLNSPCFSEKFTT